MVPLTIATGDMMPEIDARDAEPGDCSNPAAPHEGAKPYPLLAAGNLGLPTEVASTWTPNGEPIT